MPNLFRHYPIRHYRIAMLLAILVALLIITLPFLTQFAAPLSAAPVAQTNLPDFTLNAETIVTVTVAISDGQVIVVPVNLTFAAENSDGETDVSLIADVEQQAGIFIGVAPSRSIAATLQLPQVAGAATPVPTGTRVVNGTGTHVANRNANLRAGPGTNFEVVGNLRSGDAVTVTDQNSNGSWYQLDDGKWVAAFLVDPLEDN